MHVRDCFLFAEFVNTVVLITARLVLYLRVLVLDFELCGCILV